MNENISGKIARQRITRRRVISHKEWGDYIARSPQLVVKYLKAYKDEGYEYNDKDIFSVLTFHKWLVLTAMNEEAKRMDNGTGLPPTTLWGKNL